MSEPFRFPVRVYYEDTDAGGVVYHANYLRYAERARTEFLRAGGVEQREMREAEDFAFVVRRCTVDYRAPAVLDDLSCCKQGALGKGLLRRRLCELRRAPGGICSVERGGSRGRDGLHA